MMTDDEINALLEENESLRNEVEYLRSDRSPQQTGDLDANPLCNGCYAWRFSVGTAVGLASASGIWVALDAHPDVAQAIQSTLGWGTGDEAGSTLKLAIALLLAAIGPLALVVHRKWRLYKCGYPGKLAAIAASWRALREGGGRK